ncbi:fungal-specific transcription factor domain-containing protein [Coniochaeta sp. 2T2.1]|nr:fungal-specific transcription factor domain-containing protein [Coniochaeta sp. 2T2.1]
MEQYQAPANPPVRVFKRVSKACRRCRRLRTKCGNQGVAPCKPCRQAGLMDCTFPARGEPDGDLRRNTHDAVKGLEESSRGSLEARLILPPAPSDTPGWESLPPYGEVVEGVQCLTTFFFQLGFLPKLLFFESLREKPESVNFFLLFSILSVSAPFTPCLVARYGGGSNATQVFLSRASCFIMEQMFVSSLESIQGFFMMSIAEWGNGEKNKSLVHMGIAIRLAGILHLHREEAYRLPETATNEEIVYSEVARRTFWMLETFENLHSGSDSPISFSYSDITVLLPCDEHEFTFGTRPTHRAALMGTPPAVANPALTCLPLRSLFATLLQTHSLWGRVARLVSADAMQLGLGAESRIDVSDYDSLSQQLSDFERDLPRHHSWSVWNLRAFKLEGLDLAFLSAVMILRLSNIILRRSYLHDIPNARCKITTTETGRATEVDAWSTVADQLYDNMTTLHQQITAFFEYRTPEQGYPALIVFCAYVCGSLSNHLHRQPQLCPSVAPRAMGILRNSVRGLASLQVAWPFAQRWYLALRKATDDIDLEDHDPVVGQQDDSMHIAHTADEQDSMTISTFDVQFNDPLALDSMLGAFDMHLWDGFTGFDDRSPIEESLVVSAATS